MYSNPDIWTMLAQPPGYCGRVLRNAKRAVRRYYEARPILACPIIWMRERRWLFDDEYDILVDGFPRSGNTFTSVAIRISQPHLRVLSHCHRPSCVIRAWRIGKPICLVIREPVQAIASWIVYGRMPFDSAIEFYIDYYTALFPYCKYIVVAEFNDVISDFPDIVRRLGEAYGISLNAPVLDDAFKIAVQAGIREFPWAENPLQIAMPSHQRNMVLANIRSLLRQPRFIAPLGAANLVYRRVLDSTRA